MPNNGVVGTREVGVGVGCGCLATEVKAVPGDERGSEKGRGSREGLWVSSKESGP